MCALQKENLERIRADFPALAQQFWGKQLVYLDNAATSQKPKSVLELLNRMNSLTNANVHRAMYTLSDRATELYEAARTAVLAAFKDYNEPLERKIAAAMLDFYRKNAKPENYLNITGFDFATMDIQEYVDWLFDNSIFSSREKFNAAGDITVGAVAADPAYAYYNALMDVYMKVLPVQRKWAPQISEGSRKFAAGLLEWEKGKPSYPDANSTMRLSYGTVKAYSPADGILYRYYTTLNGVMEKEDPENYEFKVPAKLKELWNARDFGQYAGPDGMVPTCFLTTNDITGGNSGSPVLDADGCLIGLAFDGNWESMSSDVMFEPDLQRCICVDIRYVLFLMDKLGGAGHLLKEMNFVR